MSAIRRKAVATINGSTGKFSRGFAPPATDIRTAR